MKKIYTLIQLSLFLFITSSHINAQETISLNIDHDGIEREYILYVPASYTGDEAYPLLLNFHGYGSNALEQMFYGDFRPIAEREGFIIAHPVGTSDANGVNFFNAEWGEAVDDIGFTSSLIDTLMASHNINPNRVYSTGMSNGGFMSYTLACNLSHKIAAIASVTGTMTTVQRDSSCDPDNLTPVMEIHGTADGTVPYDGNNLFAGTDSVIDFWVTMNECVTEPSVVELEDTSPSDGSTVTHYVYANGLEGNRVELMKVNGGGHTWPGSAFVIGSTNLDISASEEIWRFFSQYELQGFVSSNENLEGTSVAFSISPNPTNDLLKIEIDNPSHDQVQIRLTNLDGQLMDNQVIQKSYATLDLSQFNSGLYLLTVTINGLSTIKRVVKM